MKTEITEIYPDLTRPIHGVLCFSLTLYILRKCVMSGS
ncbi:hypothetical protein Save01_01458 [Streptomyces avermitilis]